MKTCWISAVPAREELGFNHAEAVLSAELTLKLQIPWKVAFCLQMKCLSALPVCLGKHLVGLGGRDWRSAGSKWTVSPWEKAAVLLGPVKMSQSFQWHKFSEGPEGSCLKILLMSLINTDMLKMSNCETDRGKIMDYQQ